MRIGFLVGGFPSLSETFILSQICGLIERGHSVSILAWGEGDGEQVHEEVKRYSLLEKTTYFTKMPRGKLALVGKALLLYAVCFVRNPRAALRLASIRRNGGAKTTIRLIYGAHKLIRGEKKFDIIHCHFGPTGISAVALREAGLLCGRIVTTFHGTEEAVLDRNLGRKMYGHLFQEGDWILPVSELWQRALIEIGAPRDRTSVHHMGVATEAVPIRTAVDSSGGVVRLLSVCRLVEKKGLKYALKALCFLRKECPFSMRYDIIGDGDLRGSLEELAEQLGVDTLVHFQGERTRSEVQEFLSRADIFLQPSVTAMCQGKLDREGIPVALMEAMAKGLPVVGTNHAGIPELVDDGVSGVLVDEKDSRQLADALLTMGNNPVLRQRMGEAALRTVRREFSNTTLNTQLESLYVSLLKRNPLSNDLDPQVH